MARAHLESLTAGDRMGGSEWKRRLETMKKASEHHVNEEEAEILPPEKKCDERGLRLRRTEFERMGKEYPQAPTRCRQRGR